MGYYKYLNKLWKTPKKNFGAAAWRDRLVELRSQPAILRIHRPTRVDRARSLGYKAKPGIFVLRSRVPKGASKRAEIKGGRKPRSSGMFFTPKKSDRRIAEERAANGYPNAEVVNSYWVAEDGRYKWFEVILIDKSHPVVLSDKNLKHVAQQNRRVYRGLTSSGKKSRGLQA